MVSGSATATFPMLTSHPVGLGAAARPHHRAAARRASGPAPAGGPSDRRASHPPAYPDPRVAPAPAAPGATHEAPVRCGRGSVMTPPPPPPPPAANVSPGRTPPPGPAGPFRRWLPTGLVALVMSVTVLGGFVVAGTLPVPNVRSVALGGVVTVHPLPGWEVAHREQVSPLGVRRDHPGGVRATHPRQRGARPLALPDVGGGALALADLYAGEVLSHQLERLSVTHRVEQILLRSGLEAVRFGYIGSSRRADRRWKGPSSSRSRPPATG